jgi:hypothetical protein
MNSFSCSAVGHHPGELAIRLFCGDAGEHLAVRDSARNSRLTPAQIDAGLGAARMGSCPDRICRRLRLCLGAGVTVVIDSHQGRWAAPPDSVMIVPVILHT